MTYAFRPIILILSLLLLNFASAELHAQPRFDFGTVTMQPPLVLAQGTYLFAADFRLQSGWKIYWHSGGASALPPRVTWDAESQSHIKQTQILFPYPKKLRILTIDTLGYQGRVSLPIEIILTPESDNVQTLSGTLHYPVCKQVCIPAQQNFTLTLPQQKLQMNAQQSKHLTRLMQNIPQQKPLEAQLFWQEAQGHVQLQGKIFAPQLRGVILSQQGMFARPALKRRSDYTEIPAFLWATPLPVTGESFPVTLTAKWHGDIISTELIAHYRQQGEGSIHASDDTEARPNFVPMASRSLSWSLALLALFAGFLLNFMPCVLPVLSLKLLPSLKAVEQHAQRIDRILAACGILGGFLLMAVLLWGFRQFTFIHWGFQFQSKLFLLLMGWLMLFFMCVTLSWQQFTLPALPTLTRKLPPYLQGKLVGDFWQKIGVGIVIVWLASACTAPIIGTIIIIALSGSDAMLFTMLGLLGVGMASPYLLAASLPMRMRLLPPLGRWSVWLQRLIGIALGLTSLWFLWLLSFHLPHPVQQMGIAFSFLLLCILVFYKTRYQSLQRLPLFTISLPLIIGLAFLPLGHLTTLNPLPLQQEDSHFADFIAFAPERVPALLVQNQTIIVDVSARWCISCKVNDITVWQSVWGQSVLEHPDLLFMRGDWTLPDKKIADFLQKHQHYAIPFTIIYTPEQPRGVILPALFQKSDVRKILPERLLQNHDAP